MENFEKRSKPDQEIEYDQSVEKSSNNQKAY